MYMQHMIPSIRDPSYIAALLYFDKAAEFLSFAKAATFLNVTPSAVSHRIHALETALGKRLFERRTRQVQLTSDGAELAKVTTLVLRQLELATERLTEKTVLRVSIGPYLSAVWLMPRLSGFEAMHPGLRVDLKHVIGAATLQDVDVSILWEPEHPQSPEHHDLFDTSLVPLVSPTASMEGNFWEGDMLPVHYRDRRFWRNWLKEVGAPASFAERGEVLEDPNMVLETAAHGRGVALGFSPFIDHMLASKRLIVAHRTVISAEHTYRAFVQNRAHPLAEAFMDWLLLEAKKTLSSRSYV